MQFSTVACAQFRPKMNSSLADTRTAVAGIWDKQSFLVDLMI
jgi:hypothetical protein